MADYTSMMLAVVMLFTADTPKRLAEKAAFQALQGTWVLETVEWRGEKNAQSATLDKIELMREYHAKLPEEREVKTDLHKWRTTLTFDGISFTWRNRIVPFNCHTTRIFLTKGRYSIAGKRRPRTMKLSNLTEVCVEENGDTSKHVASGTFYYLYRVKSDTLELCIGKGGYSVKDLPSQFATDTKGRVMLFTWRREAK